MNWVTKLLMQNPSLKHLAKLGIVRETTGRDYGRDVLVEDAAAP